MTSFRDDMLKACPEFVQAIDDGLNATDPSSVSKEEWASIPGLVVESGGGACPVQYEGTLCGKQFYFRARHGGWSFRLANEGGNPIKRAQCVFFREGDDPTDGWMPAREVLNALKQCAEEYAKEAGGE